MNTHGQDRSLGHIFNDTEEVTRRFKQAVHDALLDHKRAGNPVAIWRDGKVIIVPPDEIVFENETRGANGHSDKP